MKATLILAKARIPALVQAALGLLTMAGITVPEDAAQILVENLDLVLGGIIVLTAFVPSLFEKKKPADDA